MERAATGKREKTAKPTAMLRNYTARLAGRAAVMGVALWVYFCYPRAFSVLTPGGFWERLSPLHLLWLIWMGDMLLQLRPARAVMALGSQKQFGRFYRPAGAVDEAALGAYVKQADRGAWKVLLVWSALTALIGLAAHQGWLGGPELVLVAVGFYACDMVCVLIWCPFRVFWMGNRCCATCRIFNWDHLMMFSPFFFLPGFFAKSLLAVALVIFVVWEAAWRLHPERFWEGSNRALKCKHCTDRLCGR